MLEQNVNEYASKFMEISENVINYISLQKAKLIDIIGKITDSELGIFDSDDEDIEQLVLEDDGAEQIDEDENLKAIITNENLFEA